MLAVRYVTLAALVVWLGALIAARFGDVLRHLSLVTGACGAVIVVGLFAMKFMGPPPPVFVPRLAIVFLMLMVAAASAWLAAAEVASLLLTLDIALGFVLLFWYTHE
jgi:hypothetical protein